MNDYYLTSISLFMEEKDKKCSVTPHHRFSLFKVFAKNSENLTIDLEIILLVVRFPNQTRRVIGSMEVAHVIYHAFYPTGLLMPSIMFLTWDMLHGNDFYSEV